MLWQNLFRKPTLPLSFRHDNVPYFSQFESRDRVTQFLNHEVDAVYDPLWKNSGAASPEEYSDWAWTGCGMACLKMILAHAQGRIVPLAVLGKQCLNYGGYRLPLAESAGLYYKPFCTFIAKEYGLRGRSVSKLSIDEICHALSTNTYVIASVSPTIRDLKNTPSNQGGHLILIHGYNLKQRVLYFHNPSGTTKENQENADITFEKFKKFFSRRGIVIQNH